MIPIKKICINIINIRTKPSCFKSDKIIKNENRLKNFKYVNFSSTKILKVKYSEKTKYIEIKPSKRPLIKKVFIMYKVVHRKMKLRFL